MHKANVYTHSTQPCSMQKLEYRVQYEHRCNLLTVMVKVKSNKKLKHKDIKCNFKDYI